MNLHTENKPAKDLHVCQTWVCVHCFLKCESFGLVFRGTISIIVSSQLLLCSSVVNCHYAFTHCLQTTFTTLAHPPRFAVCCHFTFNNPFHMATLHFTDHCIINILLLFQELIICPQKGRFVWPWKQVISFGWVMLHTVRMCCVLLSFLFTFHMMSSFHVIVIFFYSLTHTLCIVWNKNSEL